MDGLIVGRKWHWNKFTFQSPEGKRQQNTKNKTSSMQVRINTQEVTVNFTCQPDGVRGYSEGWESIFSGCVCECVFRRD